MTPQNSIKNSDRVSLTISRSGFLGFFGEYGLDDSEGGVWMVSSDMHFGGVICHREKGKGGGEGKYESFAAFALKVIGMQAQVVL